MFFFKRKTKVSPKLIKQIEDLATDQYTNPFSELIRIKLAARELLKELKPIKGQKK